VRRRREAGGAKCAARVAASLASSAQALDFVALYFAPVAHQIAPLAAYRGAGGAVSVPRYRKPTMASVDAKPSGLLHRLIIRRPPVFHMALKPRANAASIMGVARRARGRVARSAESSPPVALRGHHHDQRARNAFEPLALQRRCAELRLGAQAGDRRTARPGARGRRPRTTTKRQGTQPSVGRGRAPRWKK